MDWLDGKRNTQSLDLESIASGLNNNDYDEKLKERQSTKGDVLNSEKPFSNMDLNPLLLKAIEMKGYRTPSDIQGKFLPYALNSASHIISKSQSGTGKTAAFAISVLQLVDKTIPTVQCICISPTRELAIQTLNEFNTLNEFLKLNIKLVIAQQNNPNNIDHKTSGYDEYINAQIIIGTPGKLSHIIDHKINTSKIKIIVIDEADSFLLKNNVAMDKTIIRIMRSIKDISPRVFLFSATFDNDVLAFATRLAPNAIIIESQYTNSIAPLINQYYTICNSDKEKFMTVRVIFDRFTVAQSVIFLNYKEKASHLYQILSKDGYSVSLISSALSYQDREKQLADFAASNTRIMIATNLISRGIDIPQINMVINFDLPYIAYRQVDLDSYIHRIGRTARFGRSGICINLVSSDEVNVINILSSSIKQDIRILNN